MSIVADRCDFLPGQSIDGRYTVRKVLGEGAFGIVYLVEQAGCRYALKLLRLWEVPPGIRVELMKRFDMEYMTSMIDCDCLVHSVDHGKVGGNPYLVMEFCPGGDLTPLLGAGSHRLPQISRQVLTGLRALHAEGIVHRDLKPENVLFKADGTAALTDFGISGDRNHRMTTRNIIGKPNQIFGTYAYMPPEQAMRARGGATVLPTTDIWSFGVLLYQLLTGELPFGRLESHLDLAGYQSRAKKGDWSSEALSRLPDGHLWSRVLSGCLIPDYRHRLQTADEVESLIPHASITQRPVAPAAMTKPDIPQNIASTQLRVMHGLDYGKTYDLRQLASTHGRMLTVGRAPENAVPFVNDDTGYMSRRHCTIEVPDDGSQFRLRDGQWDTSRQVWTNSTNGTFVNSVPVGASGYYLATGDIITLGDVTLRFEHYQPN